MFVIRQAIPSELNKVRKFYHSLIDEMQTSRYSPGWKKDIYPDFLLLKNSIENRELYIGELDDDIVSVMIINQEANEGYQTIQWTSNIESKEVYVIHALGVHPKQSGKGFAKAMIEEVLSIGKCNGIKAIRLDVLQGNIPAEKLYVSIGFKYIDMIEMYYEDTGWTNYKLYEYVL
ncbi:GNAT family N-acetyltransferase [Amedibacillus sp. YH-ame6]